MIKDEWEHFTVRFSVHTVFEGEADDAVSQASRGHRSANLNCMRIIGSLPQLTKSGDMGSGPQIMKKCSKQFRWMIDKYG